MQLVLARARGALLGSDVTSELTWVATLPTVSQLENAASEQVLPLIQPYWMVEK